VPTLIFEQIFASFKSSSKVHGQFGDIHNFVFYGTTEFKPCFHWFCFKVGGQISSYIKEKIKSKVNITQQLYRIIYTGLKVRKFSYRKSNNTLQCIKIYFIFIWSSTCFGRHTAHHQEPKTALAASGFTYVAGCWTRSCWTLSGRELGLTASSNYTSNNLPRMQKPEAASAVLGSWWCAVFRPKLVELHINMI
jgi:hypothetical protein